MRGSVGRWKDGTSQISGSFNPESTLSLLGRKGKQVNMIALRATNNRNLNGARFVYTWDGVTVFLKNGFPVPANRAFDFGKSRC